MSATVLLPFVEMAFGGGGGLEAEVAAERRFQPTGSLAAGGEAVDSRIRKRIDAYSEQEQREGIRKKIVKRSCIAAYPCSAGVVAAVVGC